MTGSVAAVVTPPAWPTRPPDGPDRDDRQLRGPLRQPPSECFLQELQGLAQSDKQDGRGTRRELHGWIEKACSPLECGSGSTSEEAQFLRLQLLENRTPTVVRHVAEDSWPDGRRPAHAARLGHPVTPCRDLRTR